MSRNQITPRQLRIVRKLAELGIEASDNQHVKVPDVDGKWVHNPEQREAVRMMAFAIAQAETEYFERKER